MNFETELNSKTLTINGKEYSILMLPADVQHLLSIYAKWENELKTAKVEVFKLEAAIKGLSMEIDTRVRQSEL